jgi:hypothetical protein
MRTYSQPSISKLVARFDNELKNLLLQDLASAKQAKDQLVNTIKQKISKKGLSAA